MQPAAVKALASNTVSEDLVPGSPTLRSEGREEVGPVAASRDYGLLWVREWTQLL